VASGGGVTAGTPEAEGDSGGTQHTLDSDSVTIGSGNDQDIKLDGLDARHAVISRIPEHDEYVLHPHRPDGATVNGQPASGTGLHHGDRLELGGWTLIFQRDEGADHIRSDGGREGGEYSGGGITSAGGHEGEHG
jgi:hypothetical protein